MFQASSGTIRAYFTAIFLDAIHLGAGHGMGSRVAGRGGHKTVKEGAYLTPESASSM
jgi:hypothetical protein